MNEAYRKRLEILGIATVGDLLRHYPRRHENFTQVVPVVELKAEAKQTVRVRVDKAWIRGSAGRRWGRPDRGVTEAVLHDASGTMKAVWYNMPWMAAKLVDGLEVVLSGKVSRVRAGGLVMTNPAFEPPGGSGLHTGRLVPVYRETHKLTSHWLRERVSLALPTADLMQDALPREIEDRQGLPPLPVAIRRVHFPANDDELQVARRRITFYQLLVNQLAVLLSRERRLEQAAPVIPYDVDTARAIRDALPFALTNAQRKAAHAIFTDMAEPRPMARLLQGEVGSGKTAVAAMAVAMAARSGHQSLFMAPTEILAQQHARTLEPYLRPLGVNMEMLVGSSGVRDRRRVLGGLESGEVQIAVGTHALIEPTVRPRSLGLVINDEQHRFGVAQREALAQKAAVVPHVLSMTATPIPRTLQLTLYGDLSVSVLDELPPGRLPVETRLVLPLERKAAYEFVRAQVREGRQAFIICPLVEESELLEARSAIAEHARLSTEEFPDLRLGLLHGRMKPAEKDAVMEEFKAGRLDILVSTTVVEVGVDVPNATVMMIEGAERFGLAQLHQLRGRVGRGAHAAHCLLLSDVDSKESSQRLEAMARLSSGFDLAEVDLQIRGPGDLLGATGAQSGKPDEGLMVAGLLDARLIAEAREEAERVIRGGLDAYPDLALAAAEYRIAGSLS